MEDVLECIIDYRGKTPKKSKDGIPTLSAKSVKNGYIDYSECYYISPDEYNRFMTRGVPRVGDILLTTEAPLGMVARLDRDDVGIAQRLLTLRGKEGLLDNNYLMYFFRSPLGQGKLRERESGSTVTGIKQAEFKKIEIEIPEINTQKKIAFILCLFDQKIECNRNINRNLLEQLEAYYNELFVCNSLSGWKKGILSDVGTVVAGGTPSKAKAEYYTKSGIAWITPKDLSVDKSVFMSRGNIDITNLGLENSSAVLMPAGTVLFSSRAPIGYIAIAANDVTTNQGFKSVVPNENIGTEYIYFLLKQLLITIESMASGSTFKEISGKTMKNIPIIIPDDNTLKHFKEFSAPLMKQIYDNELEIKKLSDLRNVLLPKLMSGAIDFSNIKI